MRLKNNLAGALDKFSEVILRVISTIPQPLETCEIEKLVQKKVKTTRKVILKRLHILRGKGLINGRSLGSGKGVWVWWKKESFKEISKPVPVKKDIQKILSTINESDVPLDTKEVIDNVKPELTRAKVLQRLTTIWGDGVIKGKQVGSGKGVWIWWRLNAFEK